MEFKAKQTKILHNSIISALNIKAIKTNARRVYARYDVCDLTTLQKIVDYVNKNNLNYELCKVRECELHYFVDIVPHSKDAFITYCYHKNK